MLTGKFSQLTCYFPQYGLLVQTPMLIIKREHGDSYWFTTYPLYRGMTYGHEHVRMHQPERIRIVSRAFHQSICSACDLLSRLQNTAPIACHRRASSCCLLLLGWIMDRDERSVSV